MYEKYRIVKKRIGELLIERGIITHEQLQEALNIQSGNKRLLGEILIELGYVTEDQVMASLTVQYGIPFLPLETYEISPDVIKAVPADLVNKYRFVPVEKIDDLITIALADVPDNTMIKDVESVLGCKLEVFITTPTAVTKTIEKYYSQ